jgi:hypothetical protein
MYPGSPGDRAILESMGVWENESMGEWKFIIHDL